jgi:Protein of unknown function (DUF3685)
MCFSARLISFQGSRLTAPNSGLVQRSVLLEAADVVGPLLKRAGRRIGDVISWLLVTLIGRSLGLVARGVQQSVAAL